MEMYASNFHEATEPARGLSRLRGLTRHGVLSLLGRLSSPANSPTLRLLYCHHVFDDQKANFAAIIDHIQSIGEFVRTDDVVEVLAGNKPVTRHLFHLSFDDGLKNVITNGLPILRDRGVPAALFVPTAIISAPEKFQLHRRLTPNAPRLVEHASWADLEEARANGFEIGSHTRTHARLSAISESQWLIEDEVFGSKQDIASRLGECNFISWPYGGRSDAGEMVFGSIAKAGYLAAFGAFRGQVKPAMTSRFEIPRHHFEPHWPISHVRLFACGAGERSVA